MCHVFYRRLGGRAVGSRGSSRLYRASQGDEVDVHCAQYLMSLVVLLSLLLYSFVDASSLLRMYSKVFGVGVLLSLGGILFFVIGRLFVVTVWSLG